MFKKLNERLEKIINEKVVARDSRWVDGAWIDVYEKDGKIVCNCDFSIREFDTYEDAKAFYRRCYSVCDRKSGEAGTYIDMLAAIDVQENSSKKEVKEDFDRGNETYKPFLVQVDSEIEDAEPMEVTGCDTEQEAESIYKTYQKQFKDVKNARWITLAKKEGCWYEQQKLYDLKDGEEI